VRPEFERKRAAKSAAMACMMAVLGLLGEFALAQAPPQQKSVLHGTFTATAGRSAGFRGRWSGETDRPNSGSGSWVLLNDANKMVAEGTWEAQKSAAGWRGNWTARVKGGRRYSGSWQADLQDFTGKTFSDMLNRTLEKQVSGSWRSGKLAGNWWLQGTKW